MLRVAAGCCGLVRGVLGCRSGTCILLGSQRVRLVGWSVMSGLGWLKRHRWLRWLWSPSGSEVAEVSGVGQLRTIERVRYE